MILMAQKIKLLFLQQYLGIMERLSTVSQPVRQKPLGKKEDVDEKNENGKLLVEEGTTDEGNCGLSVFGNLHCHHRSSFCVADERSRWTSFRFFLKVDLSP